MAAIEDCKYKFYFINITGKNCFCSQNSNLRDIIL